LQQNCNKGVRTLLDKDVRGLGRSLAIDEFDQILVCGIYLISFIHSRSGEVYYVLKNILRQFGKHFALPIKHYLPKYSSVDWDQLRTIFRW
jgi:hypothetical protein